MHNVIRPTNPLPTFKGAVNVSWVVAGHERALAAGKEVNLPESIPFRGKNGRG
jgi:hypothetical protein